MSVSDFNEATMAETYTFVTARQAAKEHDDRNAAEWIRWLAAHVRNANPYLKKAIQPKDLLKFPDEKIGTITQSTLSPEEEKALGEKMRIAALKYQESKKK